MYRAVPEDTQTVDKFMLRLKLHKSKGSVLSGNKAGYTELECGHLHFGVFSVPKPAAGAQLVIGLLSGNSRSRSALHCLLYKVLCQTLQPTWNIRTLTNSSRLVNLELQ